MPRGSPFTTTQNPQLKGMTPKHEINAFLLATPLNIRTVQKTEPTLQINVTRKMVPRKAVDLFDGFLQEDGRGLGQNALHAKHGSLESPSAGRMKLQM